MLLWMYLCTLVGELDERSPSSTHQTGLNTKSQIFCSNCELKASMKSRAHRNSCGTQLTVCDDNIDWAGSSIDFK